MKIAGWMVACFLPVVFLIVGVSRGGAVRYASWAVFIFLVSQFAFRIRKERSIIRDQAGSVAKVVGAFRKPLEAAHISSIGFRFVAADGRVYSGRSGWTGKKLPHVGQVVPILYNRDDPSNNLALFDFRFYIFNFSGL